MTSEELLYLGAAMGRQAIPEQDDWPRQVPEELPKKLDDPLLVDGLVGMQPQEQAQAAAAGTERDGSHRREGLIAAAAAAKDRRLSGTGPGAAGERMQEKGRFIGKNG